MTKPESPRRLSRGVAPEALAVTALALLVAVVALWPQWLYASLLGRPELFVYSADEDLYAGALLVRDQLVHHRLLSEWVIRGLAAIAGTPVRGALLADALLPLLATVACYVAVRSLVATVLARCAATLGVLFANDLLSTGTFPLWDRAIGRQLRDFAGPHGAELLAVANTYSSQLFRTPDPQASFVVMFLFLALVARLVLAQEAPSRRATALLFLGTLLVTTVQPQVVVIVFALVFWLGVLLLPRDRTLGRLFLASWALGTVVWIARLLLLSTTYQSMVFESRLPILSPAVLLAAVGLVVVLVRSRTAAWPPLALAAAFFLAVLSVLQQQVVTGRMMTVAPWENSTNYTFIALGALVLARRGVGAAPTGAALPVLRVAAVGAGILVLGLVWRMQHETFERARGRNLTIDSFVGLLEDLDPEVVEGSALVYDPPLAAQYAVMKANRDLDLVLSYHERLFLPRDFLGGAPWRLEGALESSRIAFEYFFRLGWSAQEVHDLLVDQLERGSSYFPAYFFHVLETNYVHSNWRLHAPEHLISQVPRVAAEYESFFEERRERVLEPTLLLTLRSPADVQDDEVWQAEHLRTHEPTAGPATYAYRLQRR